MRLTHQLARVALAVAIASFAVGCNRPSPADLVAKSRADLDAKDARSAMIQLRSVLESDPQAGEARFLLGRALLALGDPGGAAVEFGKALDQRHESDLVLPELATALLLSQQERKLVTTYGSTSLRNPAAQSSLKTSIALAWAALGDAAKAQAAIDDALAATPRFPRALVLRARMAAGSGAADRALAMVDEVLTQDARLPEAWQLRGELLWLARNDKQAAQDAFKKAIAIDRAFVESHAALVQMRLQSNDIEGAKAQVDELRAVLPGHPHVAFMDGQLALMTSDLKTAREKAQILLRGAPENAAVLMLAGYVEARAGSPVVAQSHFAKIVKLEPENHAARRELARLHLRLGQSVKALETLQPLVGTGSVDAEALAIAGTAHLQLGNAGAAETAFTDAARLRPENRKLKVAAAWSRIGRGDSAIGLAELEKISSGADDRFASLALITARMRTGDLDQALVTADALISKFPTDASVHELRGRIQLARNDLRAARESYEKALAIDPAFFAATLGLASLDLAEKQPEAARKRLLAVVSSAPGNTAARLYLAEISERGNAPAEETRQMLADAVSAAPTEAAPRLALVEFLIRKRLLNQALEQAQQATAALPNDLDLLDALARAQALKGDTQQALSTFRRIIGLEPNRARPHLRIADIQKAEGNLGAAIASMRRALEIDPDYEPARQALVDTLLVDKRPREAVVVARELQARRPASRSGYVLEAALQQRTKNHDAAIVALRQGLKQLPDDPQLALMLVQSMLDSGQLGDAESFAREWIKNKPDDSSMHYALATVSIRRGNYDAAEAQLRRTLALTPSHALALNNLAWVLVQRGQTGALAYAKQAADLLPKNPMVLDTLALSMAMEKDYAGALATQRRAVELAPGNMELRLTLARIALQGGDKPAARSELERLAALGTRFKQHAEVARLLKTL